MTQTYNNCAETHLGGGVTSPFVFPSAAIARAHDLPVTGRVALRKGPRRFCPHRSDCCCALMLTCRNSPLWQRCERCNNVLSSFWLPWLYQFNRQRGHHVTCALIGTSRKLAAYSYAQPTTLNDAWEWAGGCKRSLPRYPKGQSRTCYQECGCHLVIREKWISSIV